MVVKKSDGFTLTEILVAISIAAILLSVAIPSFSEMIRQNRLTTSINRFTTAHNLARSEAVARGKSVSLCKSNNATTTSPSCDTGSANWEDGWIVFVNADNDNPPAVDVGEKILRVSSALTSTYSLRGSTGATAFVTYRSTGDIDIAGTFVLCDNSSISQSRAMFIGTNGRISMAKRNSDDIPLDDAGNAITTCTP